MGEFLVMFTRKCIASDGMGNTHMPGVVKEQSHCSVVPGLNGVPEITHQGTSCSVV